jgi:hypothetical protein
MSLVQFLSGTCNTVPDLIPLNLGIGHGKDDEGKGGPIWRENDENMDLK